MPVDRFGPGIASQPIEFTTIAFDGGQIVDGSITAAQLIKSEVLITEAAQMGSLVVDTASIRDLSVETLKIADNAVTNQLQTISLATLSVNVLNQRFELVRVTFGVILPGDSLFLAGVTTASMATDQLNPGRLELFIQEDDINGTVIGVPTAAQTNVTLTQGDLTMQYLSNLKTQGVFSHVGPSSLTNKSFILSAESSNFGAIQTQIDTFNNSLIAFKRSK